MFVDQLRRERVAAELPRALVPGGNFEDERLVLVDASQLGFLIEAFGRHMSGAADEGLVLRCFYEIQMVSEWERFVRRLLDAGGVEAVATGSPAALLSRENGNALRGRR